ncbi:MAG: calcium/sodium antiporter [Candidatus Gracilibacteria bacterium]|nr:calcium/sodium antiporter [Candidatus Gracilibacteria bacterium]
MSEFITFITAPLHASLLLPIGFIALIKGADYLVEGASSIAKRFHISELVIGLTIVAFGTSLPELLVTVLSGFQGATDLAIGNVIGSNISNILLILGVCAFIYPLSVSKGTIWKEIPLNLLAVIALFALANDTLLDGAQFSGLTRSDGIALMLFFIIFIYYSFGIAKNPTIPDAIAEDAQEISEDMQTMSTKKSIGYIFLGLIGLSIGGQLVINGALGIASMFGLSESFVGLTILALGTSAPELATSAIATYKKNSDIAIGNVVGSNLFNIFWVLGLTALINPLPFNPVLNADIFVCALATFLLFLFIATKNQEDRWWLYKFQNDEFTLSKTEGIVFIMSYIGYMSYLFMRG